MKFPSLVAFLFFVVSAGFLQAEGLEFDEKIVSIKAPPDAKVVTAEFKFSNAGGAPVTIKKHDASCSCMTVEISGGKLTYQPGEGGIIRANFDMGNFSGSVDKTVLLWVNDDPQNQPSVQLTTRVEIPVLVALEPKTLHWDIASKPETKVIRLTMRHDKPVHVKSVSSASEAFGHELKTIKEGEEYELHITPKEIEVPGLAIFRIETDCEIARHRTQQAFAVVRRPVVTPPSSAGTKP